MFTYKVNGTISYIFCTVGANKKWLTTPTYN